jgi:hypothetical protein
MKQLGLLALAILFSACFRTVIQQPDGNSVTVKTPCDSEIWLVTKRYGKPTQVLLSDTDDYRIRYYYASTQTEYDWGWSPMQGCYHNKRIHLTGDGLK